MAFLKPWCSSLVAARYLANIERFHELSGLCQARNRTFYQAIDSQVTSSVLERAALIGKDMPFAAPRQDDAGIIPPLTFYHDFAKGMSVSIDVDIGTTYAYALLGQGLQSVFEFEVRQMFHGSTSLVSMAAPKSFQRMQNKLLNPTEHGDPNIARPRCAQNLDVLRGCVIAKDVLQLEEAYNKVLKAFDVVRVKNTHDPSVALGYRSLLINFVFQPGLTWAQLFGGRVAFDARDSHSDGEMQFCAIEGNETYASSVWKAYVARGTPKRERLYALQGLQVISSQQPEAPVKMIAELQLVLEPYFAGRAASHLLFMIARCDTGAMEMVRDFVQEYYKREGPCDESEGPCDERLQAVRDIAMAVRLRFVTKKRTGDSEPYIFVVSM